MAEAKLDVGKWQAGRQQWHYTPVLWFYFRMIEVAYLDARGKDGDRAADDALLARDWIARSEPAETKAPHEYVSFPECCQILGLKPDVERVALLDVIDKAVDFDVDEAWERLEDLSSREPVDDVEPLFDAPRVVPALDQIVLFA
jgi:hypothetical protein